MEIEHPTPSTLVEGAQKKRRRTEAQLARKRQADRINHKAKREQQKRQMENLETQVTNLQEAVQTLTDQVRVLNERLRDQTKYLSRLECASTPSTAADGGSPSTLNQTRPPYQGQDMLLLSAENLSMKFPGPALGEPDNNVPVDCRCGVDHQSYYECLEYSTFLILFRAHQGLNKSISNSTRLPRTPSLVHVFRPTSTDNPVIQILGLVFSQVRPANVRTLFACYLIMYRFLRWRLCPDEETQRDVPTWLYPTEIQKTVPHPVCIDFLPWPGLRDRLIRNIQHIQDPRHSVILYMRSVRFSWPEDQEFVYTSEQGELMPTESFEAGIYAYENWQVSREWAATFPKLKNVVNIGDEEA
ncbi:hypothetical protein P175DRAFT_0511392 [Aspergillus ochraceoroseus IBT 24754]|uniref:BZIP domain-containing protein n=2 Tax=Aspergillus subgen. Nidulantes TaxID=2720870 RepID=A0A0F8XQ78_9EURO|nr:uncharacterized protein P175DRAFT_0511392 [Aspergillus ochraceoroseus IBT 24754]KKK25667.1 hypothetical protein ARAM_003717 [Aspergillus rambellii]PTU18982.1 hypothetical protein P175DRAFT_0511392 [Aspergillus ochraceoroseus IBT 24754]